MKCREVVQPILDFAPLFTQEGWDNCGFLVGDENSRVKGVLVALDCTTSVVEEAINIGANLIITHHPLIFGGLKNVLLSNSIGEVVQKAIKHDITIFAAHTNMDKALGGVSHIMAQKLNLINLEPLTEDGFGVIGELSVPVSVADLIERVKEKFGIDVIRTSAPLQKHIKKIALCGGSGSSFISKAFSKGAQVYISGDISYHHFFCERGFMIMDIGHYYSEYDIVYLFAELLSKKFNNFAVSISKKNNNPIYYY